MTKVRSARLRLSVAVVTCLAPSVLIASQAVADKDIPAFMALHWQRALNVDLPLSKAFISDLPGSVIVIGPEVATAGRLLGLGNIGNAEALAFDPTKQTFVIFYYAPIGFVSTNDWASVDEDRLLRKTVEITEAENAHRRMVREPEVHVINWLQKPVLNPQTHVVTWVMKVDDAGTSITNAVALKLGRFGLERLTFADQAEDVLAINRRLEEVQDALSFRNGASYADYKAGVDRKADGGITQVVNDTILSRVVGGAAVGIAFPILTALTRVSIGLILIPIYLIFKAFRKKVGPPTNRA